VVYSYEVLVAADGSRMREAWDVPAYYRPSEQRNGEQVPDASTAWEMNAAMAAAEDRW
jgi:hypothetical protein